MPISSNLRETPATKYIPYSVPLDQYTCATSDWDVTRSIQVVGVPFETAATSALNSLTEQLMTTLNGIGSRNTRVALWTHLIRRKIKYDLASVEYDNYFSQELNRQYEERLGREDFYTNELFISPVYRCAPTDAERFAQRFSRNPSQKRDAHHAALTEIEKLTQQMMMSLRRYHPTMLGTTETEDGALNADFANLYARILNGGDSGPVAVNRNLIKHAIQRSDLTFDGDVVVIDRPDSTRYAGILTLKAPYTVETMRANLLHGLLQLKCEFILSQSLTFMSAAKAERFLEIQKNQIETTSNNEDQVKELKDAITKLQNGKFGMGEHEFTLTVYGDSIQELNQAIGEVISVLDSKTIEVFRETRGGLIAQYFGMLPGNFTTKRIRAQPISVDNFVSLFPMHNFLTGNANGSQWGMPIAMLKTAGESPYFFNYHVSRQSLKEQGIQLEFDPEEDRSDLPTAEASAEVDATLVDPAMQANFPSSLDVGAGDQVEDDEIDHFSVDDLLELGSRKERRKRQRKESGNFLLIGPNGSGKTVVQALLRAFARKKSLKRARRPYRSFTFDKDSGQEIFILALGGVYFRFENGKDTGVNPFSLPDNETSHLFLVQLAKWCAAQDATYVPGVTDEDRLLSSIRQVYKLSAAKRRWARILDTIPAGSTLHAALGRYCADGTFAWVLDSAVDRFDLSAANDFGFDMTSFLEDDLVRTPILRYLKYKIDLAAPGSPYSIEMDEASTALRDEYLRYHYIEVEARTIRKKEGILGLGLQDASDASSGPLAGLLTTQFPTMMIFPNAQAEKKHYVDGLKLTDAEFKKVTSEMHEKPGMFLLKRGIESVVVQLDLSGMDDMLSVLSGSADNLPLVRGLIESFGNQPEKWLPEFFKRRA